MARQWQQKIELGDVFHDEKLSFEDIRDVVIRRLARLEWHGSEHVEFGALLDDLAQTETPEEFDFEWNRLYDWADEGKRLWIGTFSMSELRP